MIYKKNNGFTLLELLVVMVIIGLLVGYVGPQYFGQLGKSEVKAAKAQINAIRKSLDIYRLDTGHYPDQQSGLNALIIAPSNESKWHGPYLQNNIPPDPWGNHYLYRNPGQKGPIDVYSLGRDGKAGGTNEEADIFH